MFRRSFPIIRLAEKVGDEYAWSFRRLNLQTGEVTAVVLPGGATIACH
jgi:hypothetical protein